MVIRHCAPGITASRTRPSLSPGPGPLCRRLADLLTPSVSFLWRNLKWWTFPCPGNVMPGLAGPFVSNHFSWPAPCPLSGSGPGLGPNRELCGDIHSHSSGHRDQISIWLISLKEYLMTCNIFARIVFYIFVRLIIKPQNQTIGRADLICWIIVILFPVYCYTAGRNIDTLLILQTREPERA